MKSRTKRLSTFDQDIWHIAESRSEEDEWGRAFDLTTSEPEEGRIQAVLTVWHAQFEIEISDSWPPFVEMLGWLEHLIESPAGRAEFWIYGESQEHRFRVTRRPGSPERCEFEYVTTDCPGGMYVRVQIEFALLVFSFHASLKRLVATNTYEEWAREDGGRKYFYLDRTSPDHVELDLSRVETFLHEYMVGSRANRDGKG